MFSPLTGTVGDAKIEFVDLISASYTTRLNLMQNAFRVGQDARFDPPQLRRVESGSMLRDGKEVTAAAYENRVIILPIQITATSRADFATQVRALNTELTRPGGNILRVEVSNVPVYFKTFPSAPETIEYPGAGMAFSVHTVRLLAEPFGYGLEQTLASASVVRLDPAHASNPCRLDLAAPIGDVMTPAVIKVTNNSGAVAAIDTLIIGARRRGTPTSLTYAYQAESLTLGTDAAVVADAQSSNGNTARVNFTTSGSLSLQPRLTIPAASSPLGSEARGTYRVFAALYGEAAGGAVQSYQFLLATRGTSTNTYFTKDAVSTRYLVDLGLLSFPAHAGPATDHAGAATPYKHADITLYVSRLVGTGVLYFDYLIFVPADEDYLQMYPVYVDPVHANGYTMLNGPDDSLYVVETPSASSAYSYVNNPYRAGGRINLIPGQATRLVIQAGGYPQDNTGCIQLATSSAGASATVNGYVTMTVSYFPRYLGLG